LFLIQGHPRLQIHSVELNALLERSFAILTAGIEKLFSTNLPKRQVRKRYKAHCKSIYQIIPNFAKATDRDLNPRLSKTAAKGPEF
jgi:hypothetical protein